MNTHGHLWLISTGHMHNTLNFLSDRPQSFRSNEGFGESDIFASNDTAKWRFMKKQLMLAMKQYGDGLKHVEAMTLKHGQDMLQQMQDYAGAPFDPAQLLIRTMASIMLTLIYGRSLGEDTKNVVSCEEQLNKVFQENGPYMMLEMLPVSRFILPSVKKAFEEFVLEINNAINLYSNLTGERRKSYKHPHVEVLIDHFLKLSTTNRFDEDKSRIVDESDIQSVGIMLVGAGMTTTSKTLQMMLAILVNHQDIQDKAYNEIADVIGTRTPTLEDKSSMPFIEALILETLRYHSLLMYAVPHHAKCDAELNGYFIPQGTIIFPNLWGLHHDEMFWEMPWEFNPSRFIENGKFVPPDHKKRQRLFPFGAGRRQCGGEAFARSRLFILTCLMLQKFKFVQAEGHPLPNHDPRDCKADVTLLMPEYKLSVQLRK